ncbi:MAG: hypothetical protein PHI10_05045 [Dehalococcoidales bacterium]|nr:hypothetical protein [Dehalococcoidales bacterium]
MKRLVPIIALLAILMISSTYIIGILAVNDDNLNVEGTAYEDSYEGNAKIQTATSSIFGVIPMILVVIALMIGLVSIKKAYFGR